MGSLVRHRYALACACYVPSSILTVFQAPQPLALFCADPDGAGACDQVGPERLGLCTDLPIFVNTTNGVSSLQLKPLISCAMFTYVAGTLCASVPS